MVDISRGLQEDESDAGWYVLGEEPDRGGAVSLRIRRAAEAGPSLAAFAEWALVDSRNFAVKVADTAAATRLNELLGLDNVREGDEIVLDSRWNQNLKRLVIGPELARWIADCALGRRRRAPATRAAAAT